MGKCVMSRELKFNKEYKSGELILPEKRPNRKDTLGVPLEHNHARRTKERWIPRLKSV